MTIKRTTKNSSKPNCATTQDQQENDLKTLKVTFEILTRQGRALNDHQEDDKHSVLSKVRRDPNHAGE